MKPPLLGVRNLSRARDHSLRLLVERERIDRSGPSRRRTERRRRRHQKCQPRHLVRRRGRAAVVHLRQRAPPRRSRRRQWRQRPRHGRQRLRAGGTYARRPGRTLDRSGRRPGRRLVHDRAGRHRAAGAAIRDRRRSCRHADWQVGRRRPASRRAEVPPDWLVSRPDRDFRVVRGGKAYAFTSRIVPQAASGGPSVEVVAPSGLSCGTFDTKGTATTVGADGSVIANSDS